MLSWPIVVLILGVGGILVLLAKTPKGPLGQLEDLCQSVEDSQKTFEKDMLAWREIFAAKFDKALKDQDGKLATLLDADGAKKLTDRCNEITKDMITIHQKISSIGSAASLRALGRPPRSNEEDAGPR